jgi:hypothetical protein
MIRKSGICLFWLFWAPALWSQISLPEEGTVPGWTPSGPPLRFNPGSLFNHINGGAELFLEFGFRELILRRYEQGDNEITLEAYHMEGPLPALGVYLAKCGKETPLEGIDARNTGGPVQITAVRGAWFLQVNNPLGDEKAFPAMKGLLAPVLDAIPDTPVSSPLDRLPAEGRIPGSERLVRGPYGLEPVYTFGEGDVLLLGGKIFGAVADYRSGETVTTRLRIEYPDREAGRSALDNLITNLDSYITIVHQEPDGFIFRDYKEEFGTVILDENRLNIRLHLPEEPEKSGIDDL